MTIIELFFFLALPTSVAFCFLLSLPNAFTYAFFIGSSSAFLSAISISAFGIGYRLMRGHYSSKAVFPPWAWLSSVLATIGALICSWHIPMAYFGFVALGAVRVGIYGEERFKDMGWWCLVGSVVIALLLHFVLPPYSRN